MFKGVPEGDIGFVFDPETMRGPGYGFQGEALVF